MMYFVQTPKWVQHFFPKYTWRIPTKEKLIFLTFDDGPIPEVTPWVLATLADFEAKATFFMVGDNVNKYPAIFNQVVQAGHAIGNHTYHHLNGWKTKTASYLDNVQDCAKLVDSPLFRPPYGRLKPKQAKKLQQHYELIMWDVLSGDFDNTISSEQCLQHVLKNCTAGSIVVLHDSLKAEAHLRYVLPKILKYYSELGYRFMTIEHA